MSSEVNISDPAIIAELEKLNKLDGGVPFRASQQHAHHTWARTFHSSPELYIQPESLEEVEKAITLARRCRKRITTVGCGHSPSDMTCTSSWMMNLDKYNKILNVDKKSGLVTMQAGIRLYQLGAELDKLELAMPNLGSINDQSIAGAISTGTHGSTLRHSILSSSVTSLKITLANSRTLFCSPDENEELFRAALCSLGALGVVTEITFLTVPAFTLHWSQTIYPDAHMFNNWNKDLWTQAEFVRVWWFPYTRRSTVWKASKTDDSPEKMPYKPSYYDSKFGYKIYHNLLWLSHYVPRILPWVEWFVFGMQYGFGTGPKTTVEAIQPSREALLMNCLYSQYVNEWAIPLEDGPKALRRLSSWLNKLKPSDPDYVDHGIPFDNKGIWVHAPVEVRVSDTTIALKNNDGTPRKSVRPYLDSTCKDGPTLYLNATLYRPYNMDPPCRARYYQAFEYLMREYNGKPHWAKNFQTTGEEFEKMYAEDLQEFRRIRNEADPVGLFAGPWHRRYVLGDQQPRLELEEVEFTRKPLPTGGVEVFGALSMTSETGEDVEDAGYVSKPVFDEAKKAAAQEKQAKEQAKQDRLAAVRKALEEAEAQAAKLQKIEEDRRAIALEEEKARKLEHQLGNKKVADEVARQAQQLKKTQDQKNAAKAKAEKDAEEHRLEQEADIKKAADKLEEQQRIKRETDEVAVKQAEKLEVKKEDEAESDVKAQKAGKELCLKHEADAKKAELLNQQRIKREADERVAKQAKEAELTRQKEEAEREATKAESEKLKKMEDERRAVQAESKRIAEDKSEQVRLAEIERHREESERLARIEAEKSEHIRMAELERKRKEEEKAQQSRLAELERKKKEETKKREAEKAAAAAEAARLQSIESARLAEVERTKNELKKKEESDRLAAIAKKEEDEELAVNQAKKDEDLRQAEIARKEKEARLAKEAEAARLEQQRVLEERRLAEEKRKADERAEKARQMAERQKQAEIERQAAIEKRKKEEEENAKLAAIEAQRLREEARERAALRQQQLEEARAAREREEHEKRMVAEHDRRENAKREALLREKEEKDRLARVAHDNAMRLEAGRKAREAKEREERLEREKLAEDARQIEKKRLMDEKRRQIAEKKEAQRIALAQKLAERKEAQAARKAIEDAAAKKAQEERAAQDKIEADAKKKKAEEVRKAFMAQVAARAAEAKERESQEKPRRSLTPRNNASPTPSHSNDNKEPSTSPSNGKSENSKPLAPPSPIADQDKETPTSPKSPRSPRAAKIFRPTIGTPTPSMLLAKREGLEPSASARAQKRIKIEEAEEPILPVRASSGVWKPQSRPNSLDELLAQQEMERENESDN